MVGDETWRGVIELLFCETPSEVVELKNEEDEELLFRVTSFSVLIPQSPVPICSVTTTRALDQSTRQSTEISDVRMKLMLVHKQV